MTFRVLGDGLPVGQVGGLEFYPQPQGVEIPLTIQGLLLWLKADAGTFQDSAKTTGAASDGDVVGAWVDQSGSGNDATQATSDNKPLLKLNIANGRSVCRFDGSNDFLTSSLDLSLSASDDLTIFAVVNPTATAALKDIVGNLNDSAPNQGLTVRHDIDEKLAFFTRVSAGNVTTVTAAVADTNFVLGVAKLDSGTQTLYKNGASEGSGAQRNMTGHDTTLYIGKNRASGAGDYAGDMAEILIYNSALSDKNRASVEGYLNARYAIF
jgi:hypothetical protein